MSRIIQWNTKVYMIGAALLASLFFIFNVSISDWNKHSSDMSFSQLQSKQRTIAPVLQFGPTLPAMPKSTFQPVKVIPKASSITAPAASAVPSIHSVPATASVQVPVPEKISAPPAAKTTPKTAPKTNPVYQVTAYYLNVRAMPNADAEIIRLLKQGSRIHVKQATGNGWLALEGGGYVHGRYAVPLSEEAASDPKAVETAPLSKPVKKSGIVAIASAAGIASIEAAADANEPKGSGNPIKPGSKIMSDSGLTKAHITALLKGTKLQGYGLEDVILGVEKEYGINAFFTIAVMKLESGNGKSTLSRTKNNLFGLNAITGKAHQKAFSFKSKGDSIRKFGQLINDNYVERGLTTVEKVGRKYCPANGLWAGHVRKIMRSDFGKLT